VKFKCAPLPRRCNGRIDAGMNACTGPADALIRRRPWPAFLCFGLLLLITLGAAQHRTLIQREAEEQYWRKMHEQDGQDGKSEAEQLVAAREAALAAIPDLVKAGAAAQRELIAAQDGPPAAVEVSILEGKGDYIRFGAAILLIAGVTAITLRRHRREAEIRALSGKYLCDGVEAAYFNMPALFAEAIVPIPAIEGPDFANNAPADATPVEDGLTEFFAHAQDSITEMRKVLAELSRATTEPDKQSVLMRVYSLITSMKDQARSWTLRPVWQLSSALELLVKRLSDKPKEATPSTVRTVANAIDLLADLCVRGIRPDLVINPPIAVMAVDDDPLCLRAVVFALQKAEMVPDTAATGERAVELAQEKPYDVIFMDIQMPGIDGLTACSQIHEIERNQATPVIFVTVQSDFRTRAESNLIGGSDLLAKPFLMFEITVKALTLAMRKRLKLAASCNFQVTRLAGGTTLPEPEVVNAS